MRRHDCSRRAGTSTTRCARSSCAARSQSSTAERRNASCDARQRTLQISRSRAHSLEVRVPFLDHRVVELCAQLPAGLKVRGLTRKYLLKQVARGLVPDEVIDRPKVGFFNSVADDWFRAQLRVSVPEVLLGDAPHYGEFLDRSEVARLLQANAAGDTSSSYLLLSILLLEIWLTSYLPRALDAAAAGPRATQSAGAADVTR